MKILWSLMRANTTDAKSHKSFVFIFTWYFLGDIFCTTYVYFNQCTPWNQINHTYSVIISLTFYFQIEGMRSNSPVANLNNIPTYSICENEKNIYFIYIIGFHLNLFSLLLIFFNSLQFLVSFFFGEILQG